jgi:hypothetical protein
MTSKNHMTERFFYYKIEAMALVQALQENIHSTHPTSSKLSTNNLKTHVSSLFMAARTNAASSNSPVGV